MTSEVKKKGGRISKENPVPRSWVGRKYPMGRCQRRAGRNEGSTRVGKKGAGNERGMHAPRIPNGLFNCPLGQ